MLPPGINFWHGRELIIVRQKICVYIVCHVYPYETLAYIYCYHHNHHSLWNKHAEQKRSRKKKLRIYTRHTLVVLKSLVYYFIKTTKALILFNEKWVRWMHGNKLFYGSYSNHRWPQLIKRVFSHTYAHIILRNVDFIIIIIATPEVCNTGTRAKSTRFSLRWHRIWLLCIILNENEKLNSNGIGDLIWKYIYLDI